MCSIQLDQNIFRANHQFMTHSSWTVPNPTLFKSPSSLKTSFPSMSLSDSFQSQTAACAAALVCEEAQHSLDAISDRLGVVIPEEDRHTAMGDTIATTEVFLKFLAMLESRGVETFGEVLSETKKHRRLLEDLNG